MRLWDAASGQLTGTLPGYTGAMNGVAFSPDSHQLASAGFYCTVYLGDVAGGPLTATTRGHTGTVRRVVFSPDGRRLASAADDVTIRLWDVGSGECTAILKGHTGAVNGVAYSPDGRWLASAGDDQTVRLWDACTTWAHCAVRLGVPATAITWGVPGIALGMQSAVVRLDLDDRGGSGSGTQLTS